MPRIRSLLSFVRGAMRSAALALPLVAFVTAASPPVLAGVFCPGSDVPGCTCPMHVNPSHGVVREPCCCQPIQGAHVAKQIASADPTEASVALLGSPLAGVSSRDSLRPEPSFDRSASGPDPPFFLLERTLRI